MNNEYSSDPLTHLRAWLDTDVIALASASADGAPSVRMVLLKAADERGFLFFTSYEGRKGRELAENPRAAMLVHLLEQHHPNRRSAVRARSRHRDHVGVEPRSELFERIR